MGKRVGLTKFLREYSMLEQTTHWPCDLDLVDFKTLPLQLHRTSRHSLKNAHKRPFQAFNTHYDVKASNDAGLILHRNKFDCAFRAHHHDLAGTCSQPIEKQ